ncbi:MAG: Acyl carrier protein phosphodiesterase [Candidatus Erwinia impunctatus]|nr:Acyl carrier protein phosphodiesterase [Culicoides impunctatus]
MNYLAHLHLASLAGSSLLGNMMADFIRGNPADHWPADISGGIRFHRRIDAFTDTHPDVRLARSYFRPETYRVSAITLDLIWDHFLSLHWQQIEQRITLTDFLQQTQHHLIPQLPATPPAFQKMNHALWQGRWLENYARPDYLEDVLKAMARRRPRLHALADSWQDFITHYDFFETKFWQFYPKLLTFALQERTMSVSADWASPPLYQHNKRRG